MTNKKRIGSFYTPRIIADFMVDYLSRKVQGKDLSILEPSVGDGIFIKSILRNKDFYSRIKSITVIEREKEELDKVERDEKIKLNLLDFLDFQKHNQETFSLVIGNPPYIKKNHLTEKQITVCEEIHAVFPMLSKNKIKNIWTAFLVRSIKFLKQDGVLALVLPAELLQVKYAVELRNLLKVEFQRIEIFTFKELLFDDCKGQDTMLLICERQSENKGVFFTNIKNINELQKFNFKLTKNIHVQDSKWNHQLTSDEYELLFKLSKQLKTVNHYCTSKAGIVTAANDFFIVNQATVDKYALSEYKRPIIQKGFFVNGSVELNIDDFNKLINGSKPSFLIALNSETKNINSSSLQHYLKLGKERKLDERYKMTIREKWYEVPNIGTVPEAFFFKRCNEYPKLIKNNAQVLVTDSAYKVEMNDGFVINDLIYSFYNSLTLCFAELNGRFYGGGVLELTPNEFKNLPIPFTKSTDFKGYVKQFKDKQSIKEICNANDEIILKSVFNDINTYEIKMLSAIREKLFLKRIKS
jgi:adenine-specific DNA-methyltransferase